MYVFNFENVDSNDKVLVQFPRPMGSEMLFLRPWSPDLDLLKEDFKAVPVWIRLPGLKLHYYTNEALSKFVSFIGRPLHSDQHTALQTSDSFASVELSVESLRPSCIPFVDEKGESVSQVIEYEWIPSSCEKCKCFGHSLNKCPSLPRVDKRWVPKVVQNDNKVQETECKLDKGELCIVTNKMEDNEEAAVTVEKENLASKPIEEQSTEISELAMEKELFDGLSNQNSSSTHKDTLSSTSNIPIKGIEVVLPIENIFSPLMNMVVNNGEARNSGIVKGVKQKAWGKNTALSLHK
nr:uncharacterized protein LOC113714137 [Coffea arabica]